MISSLTDEYDESFPSVVFFFKIVTHGHDMQRTSAQKVRSIFYCSNFNETVNGKAFDIFSQVFVLGLHVTPFCGRIYLTLFFRWICC